MWAASLSLRGLPLLLRVDSVHELLQPALGRIVIAQTAGEIRIEQLLWKTVTKRVARPLILRKAQVAPDDVLE